MLVVNVLLHTPGLHSSSQSVRPNLNGPPFYMECSDYDLRLVCSYTKWIGPYFRLQSQFGMLQIKWKRFPFVKSGLRLAKRKVT